MKRIIGALVAPILAVTGLVLGASPAHAQPTVSIDLVIGDRGTLIGKGAVATVSGVITCSFTGDFQFADGLAGFRQVQGRRIVGAQGGVSLSAEDCDGTPHGFEYTFFASDVPFRPGVAVISGLVNLCAVDPGTGEQACTSDADGPKEVRLKN
jgi:hypothetical protein